MYEARHGRGCKKAETLMSTSRKKHEKGSWKRHYHVSKTIPIKDIKLMRIKCVQ